MIVTLKSILKIAESQNIAVGAFNAASLDGIRAVLDAAEEVKQPVILQFAPAAHERYIPFSEIGPAMTLLADKACVPVCVHLDHGADIAEVKTALDMGFTGVMYDGSLLPYAQNAANTCAVVELAKRYGASVEAEIGCMGAGEDSSAGGEARYTDPDLAAQFVSETGVDALACSFGTAHGIYASKPVLDISRIRQIREKIHVPIVMHGGSGIGDDDFRKCIQNGVRKINFYTYAAGYAGEAVQRSVQNQIGNIFAHDLSVVMYESMKRTYAGAMRVFSLDCGS